VRLFFLGSQFRLILALGLGLLFIASSVAWSQEADLNCAAVKDRWEQTIQKLTVKLEDLEATRRIPLDRVVQRRLVEAGVGKNIARQVSEAIQAKEGILDAKRKECLNLLNAENQAYTEYERCGQDRRGPKKNNFQQMAGKRRTLIQKGQTAIAEVREVEGKDTYAQYVDPWRGQGDVYNRGAETYWQRMNQGYWGR